MQFPQLRSCVKVEVVVLGSSSLIVIMVSVDVKQHWSELLVQGPAYGGLFRTDRALQAWAFV